MIMISWYLLNFYHRTRGAANTIAKEYVLPDYTHIKRGHVRQSGESAAKSGSEQVRLSINISGSVSIS